MTKLTVFFFNVTVLVRMVSNILHHSRKTSSRCKCSLCIYPILIKVITWNQHNGWVNKLWPKRIWSEALSVPYWSGSISRILNFSFRFFSCGLGRVMILLHHVLWALDEATHIKLAIVKCWLHLCSALQAQHLTQRDHSVLSRWS